LLKSRTISYLCESIWLRVGVFFLFISTHSSCCTFGFMEQHASEKPEEQKQNMQREEFLLYSRPTR
jgi:hypothetical protein